MEGIVLSVHHFFPLSDGLNNINIITITTFQYADPVADLLDKRRVFRARLFREACVFHKGNYVKVGILSFFHEFLQKTVKNDDF